MIFVATNYVRTGSFKEVQQLFEQRFCDRDSPTNITIRNVKKYKTEGSSLNPNDRTSLMSQENRTYTGNH